MWTPKLSFVFLNLGTDFQCLVLLTHLTLFDFTCYNGDKYTEDYRFISVIYLRKSIGEPSLFAKEKNRILLDYVMDVASTRHKVDRNCRGCLPWRSSSARLGRLLPAGKLDNIFIWFLSVKCQRIRFCCFGGALWSILKIFLLLLSLFRGDSIKFV